MRFWLGIAMMIGGVALWLAARREREAVPPWLQRLALGVASLGFATLAATRQGVGWSVASICYSLIAIALIGSVVWDSLRRR